MRLLFLLLLGSASFVVLSAEEQRIVGGSLTTITQYPFVVSLLSSSNFNIFWQKCGGTIITRTAVLTAAHCFIDVAANRVRVRVGSSFANSGGTVHNVRNIINHPYYNRITQDSDVAVLRTQTAFIYNNITVAPAKIAGANYIITDNAIVWAMGWGSTTYGGQPSELLRHVQLWIVNQATCMDRYRLLSIMITDNMMCSGWLNVGGRDQCQNDSGGPLVQGNVIVGITSFGEGCASPYYPGVNTRVSRFSSWITNAAK